MYTTDSQSKGKKGAKICSKILFAVHSRIFQVMINICIYVVLILLFSDYLNDRPSLNPSVHLVLRFDTAVAGPLLKKYTYFFPKDK